ncbi:hypothetical protein [Campylobacter vulpis]|uniref:hypothetical protein n=1 Tax=Campylobacter vulpis TaxID=1655500 RepID=UPI001BCAAB92|nr:hypothetical protein [Campylobacter vulpis]
MESLKGFSKSLESEFKAKHGFAKQRHGLGLESCGCNSGLGNLLPPLKSKLK